MKTTIDIHDELLTRAKRRARETERSLRAVVEEGLRQVLATDADPTLYRLQDLSVGSPEDRDPLDSYSWQDLRDTIYDDRPAQ